jgi:hypothetical protein
VNGDRRSDYGHPLDNFGDIAAIWSVILRVPVTAEQAALCMVGLKLARQANKGKRDNLVDLAGYTQVVEMIGTERERRAAELSEPPCYIDHNAFI